MTLFKKSHKFADCFRTQYVFNVAPLYRLLRKQPSLLCDFMHWKLWMNKFVASLYLIQFNDSVRRYVHIIPLMTQVLRFFLRSSAALTREVGSSSGHEIGEYQQFPACDRVTIQKIPRLKFILLFSISWKTVSTARPKYDIIFYISGS